MSNAVYWIVGWAGVAIAAAIVAGILASVKNRDYSFWIAWTFLVPPMLLALAVLPRYQGPRPRRPSLDEEDKNW